MCFPPGARPGLVCSGIDGRGMCYGPHMLRSPDQASYQRRPGSHLAGAGVHGSPQAQSARRNNTWARRCSGPVRAKVGGAAGHRSAHAAADGFAASAIADGNRG
ncbi:hypothetical protein LPJ57_007666, partial [Coemansia sp. RSA 486]